MSLQQSSKALNKLILVAALGYFVDIYDLILFVCERTESLTEILKNTLASSELINLEKHVKNESINMFNCQMIGMLVGGLFWGMVGDKKGRLTVLFGSIITYSIGNILNGFVEDTFWFGVLRFVSGFGLAGELGAGITLVSESMTKEKRGHGVMIVATVGVFGAVIAGLTCHIMPSWRWSYFIGGGMGIALLLMRIGVFESGMFENVKHSNVKKGNFLSLFKSWKQAKKYLNIIFVALPVWYVMGLLMQFAKLFGKEYGLPETELPADDYTIVCAYGGITVGDFFSGWLSQKIKSRKKVLGLFLFLTVISCILYFTVAFTSITIFYISTVFIGFATGYWAVFIGTASELFGTNIRSTVTTTAPNFVRGGAVLLTLSFKAFSPNYGNVSTAITIGAVVLLISFVALYSLEETYGKDLNYIEE